MADRGPVPEVHPLSPAAALAGLVGFHAAVQVLTLSFSLAGVRIGQALALSVLALAVLLGGVCARPFWEPAAEAETPTPLLPRVVPWIALVLYVFLWIQAWSRPDYSWDGNVYHIPPINFWARRGYVYWIDPRLPQSDLMNGYPKAAELFSFILVTATATSRLLTAANLCFLPLGVAAVAGLSRCLGVSRAGAWAAGSLLVFVPVVIWQSITTYVDVAYACCVMGLFAAAVLTCEQLAAGSDWRSASVVAGAAAGLTAGAKGSGPLVVAICLAVVGTAALRRCAVRARLAGALAAISVVALVVGGYWYLRNLWYTGSPVYPVGISAAGHTLFPGRSLPDVLEIAAMTPERLAHWPGALQVLYTWVQGVRQWPETSYGWDSRLGGLGYLWLSGCVPAIVTALVTCRTKPPALRMLAALTAAAFLVTPMNWWARYTVWIYALGLPCAALALERARRTPLAAWWAGLCVAVALTEAGLSISLILRNGHPGEPALGMRVGYTLRPTHRCYLFPEMRGTAFEAVLAGHENAGVGELSGDTEAGLLMGELSQPIGYRDLIPLPSGPPDLKELRRRGIRYLVYDEASDPPELPAAAVAETGEIAGFRLITLR